MADLEFVADFTDLQLMRRELVGVAKDAKQSAGVFEREYNKVERQITRTAKASQQHYNELLKVDRASKSAANSADVFNRELGKQEANLERLRMKFVEGHAAMDIYSKELNDLAVARKNDIITAAQQEKAIEQLNIELANGTILQRGSQRGMNAMGMAIQQTGYQVGDFLVQIQSGTNWMVAFGQQATQLVGILPMFSTKLVGIAAGLGIVIPLATALGAMWMRSGQDAKDASSAIDSLDRSLKEYKKTQEAISRGMTLNEMLSVDELSSVRTQLKGIREELNSITTLGVAKSFLESIPLLGSSVGLGRQEQIAALKDAEQQAIERIRDLEKKLADERAQYAEEESKNLEQQIAIQRLSLQFGEDSVAVKRLENQQALENFETELRKKGITEESITSLLERLRVSQDLTAQQTESADEAQRFFNILEMADLSHLVDQSASLAVNMASAADNAAAALAARALDVANAPNIAYAGRGTTSSRPAFQMDDQGRVTTVGQILSEQERARKASSRGSSGGGGGAAKEQEDYVGKLLAEAEQKRKLIGLSEEETRRQEILYQLKEKGLPTDDKRIEQIIQMEAETRKLMEAEQQREQLMQTVTSNIESAFMTVVDGSKSVEDAFRGMLRNIILAVYQQQVAKPAATAIGSLISGIIPSFDGGGFTGYGSRSGGLDGKGGSLAMVHPNETVIDHTKGQSMGSVQVVNNFNISANGDESVKRIIRGEVPRITEATKVAVLDAKRRGGSYGRAF